MPGGTLPGGTPPTGTGTGSTAGTPPGTEDSGSWENGTPGGGNDGWETSNQIPGVGTNPIPPMPSERGLPPGGQDGSGGTGADQELDKALEDFDGGILAERDIIRARSNEAAGTSGVPAQLPAGSTTDSQAESGTTTSAPRGVPSQRSAPPGPVASAGGAIPEDIPDAKDDDIIARQLREAAMNEADPELREKLWEEYRRYKGA